MPESYKEALPGSSHIYGSDDLNETSLSHGCSLGVAPRVGTVSGTYILGAGDREQDSFPESISRVNWQSHPFDDFLQWPDPRITAVNQADMVPAYSLMDVYVSVYLTQCLTCSSGIIYNLILFPQMPRVGEFCTEVYFKC